VDDRLTLAHGLGGPADLPLPPELAIAGAVAALVVSFTVLSVAWRTPRFDEETSGRPAPAWLARLVDSPGYAVAVRVVGMVLLGYVVVAAVFGKDLLTNPVFGIFYVWWWVGLVPASVLLGPVWRALSPVRTVNTAVARLTGSDPDRGLYTYPERLGYWPAAVGLFAFVWMELVYPHSTELGPVRLWMAVYAAAMLLGGALFGSSFYRLGDPFEVFSTLCGKLSVWGRRNGVLVVRSPLANLDTTRVAPGLVAVVGVLFGSTAFDSFRESLAWIRYVQASDLPATLLGLAALFAFCAGVALILTVGSMATGVDADTPRRRLPGLFAHSIVPIIVGYFVAHYLNYFVDVGWQTLSQASDPLGTGADLFGTADLAPLTSLSSQPALLASLKVAAVVLGHVVAAVAAHDRALKVLPPRHQLTGQLPMLFVMIAFTVGGLYLLFAA
jgi:hypothetical protein